MCFCICLNVYCWREESSFVPGFYNTMFCCSCFSVQHILLGKKKKSAELSWLLSRTQKLLCFPEPETESELENWAWWLCNYNVILSLCSLKCQHEEKKGYRLLFSHYYGVPLNTAKNIKHIFRNKGRLSKWDHAEAFVALAGLFLMSELAQ